MVGGDAGFSVSASSVGVGDGLSCISVGCVVVSVVVDAGTGAVGKAVEVVEIVACVAGVATGAEGVERFRAGGICFVEICAVVV